MEGIITIDGRLKIQRVGRSLYQFCPYALSTGEDPVLAICDDQCPQFSEPVTISPTETRLEICQGKILKFTDLKDERE